MFSVSSLHPFKGVENGITMIQRDLLIRNLTKAIGIVLRYHFQKKVNSRMLEKFSMEIGPVVLLTTY